MTFGEKIQKLRKEAGLSQEELSCQLGVSRQAISKWECDSGYPETEKIVRMSRIFHVTLDYLLNEEDTQAKETDMEDGIYVSREMAEGFLTYQKQKFLKIAIAAGSIVGGLSLPLVLEEISMLLVMLIMIAGMLLLISVKLTDNPYGKLGKEPLLFDKEVRQELNAAYAEKKKALQLGNLCGIALIAIGFLVFPLAVPVGLGFNDTMVLGAGMIVAGIGTYLCIYMSGMMFTYHLLILNEEYRSKRK